MADASEVRDGRDGGRLGDSFDQVMSQFASAAAGAVGDRDECWAERFQFSNGLIEVFPSSG